MSVDLFPQPPQYLHNCCMNKEGTELEIKLHMQKRDMNFSYQDCPGYCQYWVPSWLIIVTNYKLPYEYTGVRLITLETNYYGSGSGL